ncbi:NAD(P)-dependent oxidoreductase [Amycolatopsis sp. NPDC049253]|uniref:NAD(P)-dependent oxidoreductase n=1 Tax=Amycolatopsis sp. NPDC049253 TaxID=3155274 RepID=UPI00343123EC
MRVGFIGLGNMGLGMARNLVKAGFETAVRDLRQAAVDELVAAGATAAASGAEAARDADLVCVAVFTSEQIRHVVVGGEDEPGVLAAARPGSVIALHSTIEPAVVAEVAEAAAGRGVRVIDVAMTGGGDVAAAEGTLTFLVGGDEAAVGLARPALEAMSRSIHHVGGLGSGVTAKIVSNFLLDGTIALVREALRIADSGGIPEPRILEIIGDGGVGSSWVSNNWARIRTQEAEHWDGARGVVAMWHKDVNLAHSLARANGVHAPVLGFLVSDIAPEITDRGLTV